MIIWLIGLSGSGKTTTGNLVYKKLKKKNRSVVFIDGDDIRKLWNDNLGYTLKEREKNASRVSNFCKFLDSQGIDVVASILSNFPKWQKWNRKNFSHYFQVYLDVPINILKKRDTKGIYSNNNKNIVGVDIKFNPPYKSDLHIKYSPENSALNVAETILIKLLK